MARWSPLEIQILLHCYCRRDDIENKNCPAQLSAIGALLKESLIETAPPITDVSDCTYVTTEKGYKMVKMICETPIPKHIWVDPRFDIKIE